MKDNTLSQYVDEIKYFLKHKLYYIPVLIVALFSYGFLVTHYSVNIDTLSSERYFEQGLLLGQGRLTAAVIHKIFNVMEFNPFLVDGIAVIILILAAIGMCTLFKRITKDKLSLASYTIFSCLFLSYPLINEIFVYTPASISISLGFFMVSISLIIMYELLNKAKLGWILLTGIILFLATSLYESFLIVYLVGIFIILILRCLVNKLKFKEMVEIFLMLLIPALISLVLEFTLPELIIKIFGIERNGNAEKSILYGELGIIGGIKNLGITMLEKYFINGLFYLPIAVFVFSNIACIISSIFLSIKNKNIMFILLFLGLMIGTISLSILQGEAATYRTCQTFQVFCPFAIVILYEIINANTKQTLKIATTIAVSILIFYQVKDLHTIFYLNYVRYEEEKNTLIKVCNEIEAKYGNEKPVVFCGSYQLSNYLTDKIYVKKEDNRMELARKILKCFDEGADTYDDDYKYIEANINSYLTWAQRAFDEVNTELYKWMDMLGYKFKTVDINVIKKYIQYIRNENEILKTETEIIEMEDFILVNI